MEWISIIIVFMLTREFNKGRYNNEYISLIKLPVLAHKNENLAAYFDTAASYLKSWFDNEWYEG